MLVPNPADSFSGNITKWLLKVSELGSDICITSKPDEAHLILFVDSYTDPEYHFIRHHAFIRSHPQKCFLFSQLDQPIHLLPGIYTSLDQRYYVPGWSSSFCFVDTYRRNPYLTEARQRCSTRSLFMSFLGRRSHPVRDRLLALSFDRSNVIIEPTDGYNHWAARNQTAEQAEKRYAEVSAASKFILCPRGAGVSSIRLFEAMELGCVPVIISDHWVAPLGPSWQDFSIRVPEQKINRLEAILAEREADWNAMATLARQEWLHWFQERQFLRQIVHRILTLTPSDRTLRWKCEASALVRLRWRWMRCSAVGYTKMRLRQLLALCQVGSG